MKLSRDAIQNLLGQSLNINNKKLLKSNNRVPAYDNNNHVIEYIDSFGVKTNDTIYFFKKDDKYIMCSSDDQTHLILGEFELENNEELNINELPINFKDHIETLSSEIESFQEYYENNVEDDISLTANDSNNIIDETTDIKSNWVTIEPLVKTKWGQTAPYNNDLPVDTVNTPPAGSGYSPRVCTGCVATALAQIIAYWGMIGINGVKYKIGCKATTAYTSNNNGFTYKAQPLPALEQFDYENMQNTYYVNQNNAEPYKTPATNAVSQLMKYVGHAIQIKYSRLASSGQHEVALNLSKSLLYFNSSIDSNDSYYQSKWGDNYILYFENKIYNELLNKRPVYISGSSDTAGGHAFICDGYDKSQDKFHINWGWAGNYDGNFKLSALIAIPNKNTHDFNTEKKITVNFYPEQYINDIRKGDFNGDGTINLQDSVFLSNTISNNVAIPEYDINGDGYVNIKDVNALIDRINNKGLKRKFNLAINNQLYFNDNFDYNNEINYKYKTINVDKTNKKIKIVTKTRGSSGNVSTSEDTLNLPSITDIRANIKSIINSKSSSIKNIFNTYVNTLTNRYVSDASKNAIVGLNANKDNLFYETDDFVDLGLSVKWASKNIGATNPEDTGNFYAWGELEQKSTYSWATYQYYSNSAAQYISPDISKSDNYDLAYHLDKSSCMPTQAQFQELINKCIWTKVKKNNKDVWEVQGPNGNVIYLPLGGCSYDGKIYYATYAYCWTSSYYSANNNQSYAFYTKSGTTPTIKYYDRKCGLPIRPVKVKRVMDFIDLGLQSHTKWSDINIGADNPYDYGNRYAWGELVPRTTFTLDSSGAYKYFSYQSLDLGASISKNIKYDAAYKLDTNLSMPTADQWTELLNNCTWTETTKNNVKGFEVKSSNGNSIFLPLTGYMSDKAITKTKTYYASGSIYTDNTYKFSTACLLTSGKSSSVSYVSKYIGTPIRAVANKGKTSSLVTLVDLGLSVNWANMNIGATNPEDTGNFYAWGELNTKTNYSWNTYTHYATVPQLYHNLPLNINKNILYDAAYAIEDNTMCMPSVSQYQELIDNCTWTKKVIGSHLVWEIKGPNNNSIILPICGACRIWNILWAYGAYYWTSEQPSDKQSTAKILCTTGDNKISIVNLEKYWGLPIRPVKIS